MKVNLVPCPDCGAPAQLSRGCYRMTQQTYSTVHCTNFLCHLHGNTLHFTASTPNESDMQAMQSWNERYEGLLPDRSLVHAESFMSHLGLHFAKGRRELRA